MIILERHANCVRVNYKLKIKTKITTKTTLTVTTKTMAICHQCTVSVDLLNISIDFDTKAGVNLLRQNIMSALCTMADY